jgi:hypothetical protein
MEWKDLNGYVNGILGYSIAAAQQTDLKANSVFYFFCSIVSKDL